MAYTTRELTPQTYDDFARLAKKQGGCWCMYYQRPRPLDRGLSDRARASANKKDKSRLVREGRSHAILVYEGDEAVGWCQYGTRDELPRIDAGRFYKKIGIPAGEETLWRITCFFVDRSHRGKGIAKIGLKAALQSIQEKGGGIVEAYPVVSRKMAAVPEWRWFGTPSMFEREGFKKVSPLGASLVLMRKSVSPRQEPTA